MVVLTQCCCGFLTRAAPILGTKATDCCRRATREVAAHLRFTLPERSESAPAAVVVAAELADPAKPGPAASKSITPAGGVGGIAPPSRERCNPARISGSQTAT